jgi:hypothetical protein
MERKMTKTEIMRRLEADLIAEQHAVALHQGVAAGLDHALKVLRGEVKEPQQGVVHASKPRPR